MNKILNITLYILIATVWIVNGLYCKILNQVPRHQQIVEHILATDYSRILTILIGVLEIIMAIWFLSRYKSKLNATLQIFVVAVMNILELLLVPELLLWGKLNFLFAIMFIMVVYYYEFILRKPQV